MAITSPDAPSTVLQIPLDKILTPDNVRELDEEFLMDLQRSIVARGAIIAPVEVLPPNSDGDYLLVAGFHRVEAARRLSMETVPATYGDDEHEHADRALENIARKQLNPYEEAIAVKRLLDQGYSEDGAADLLCWSRQRVTARTRLLELPERAQRLVGDGDLPLATVQVMRTIQDTSPPLLASVLAYINEDNISDVRHYLLHRPAMLLAHAVEAAEDPDVFVAALDRVPVYRLSEVGLDDEETIAALQEATELHKKLDRYSYGPPQLRFSEADVDRARAAGVLLEHEGEGAPLITDRALYQDLCRAALRAAPEQIRQQIKARAAETATEQAAEKPKDPFSEETARYGREIRQLAGTAHSANLDLGDSLRNGLSVVNPDDLSVARFFCYAALGVESSFYGNDTRVNAIALRAVRLVIGEFRKDVTKTKKDGSKGVTRYDYGDPSKLENLTHWIWSYLDGAHTAGELYGRTLVLIAAERYASRLVIPASQQRPPISWSSHQHRAIKALQKLAGPHVAPTLRALEAAVAKVNAEHDENLAALRGSTHGAVTVHHDAADVDDDGLDDDDFAVEDDPDLDGINLGEDLAARQVHPSTRDATPVSPGELAAAATEAEPEAQTASAEQSDVVAPAATDPTVDETELIDASGEIDF